MDDEQVAAFIPTADDANVLVLRIEHQVAGLGFAPGDVGAVGVLGVGTAAVAYDYGSGAFRSMVETMTYGNGQEVFYTYNALGLIVAVGYTGQPNRFQYTYDADGSLASTYDSGIGQTTEYNESGYEIRSANGAILYSYTGGEDNHYTETVNGVTYQSTLQNQNNGSSSTKEIKDSSGSGILSANTSYDVSRKCT